MLVAPKQKPIKYVVVMVAREQQCLEGSSNLSAQRLAAKETTCRPQVHDRAQLTLENDKPIKVEDARQRMVVALVQKKVSELLGHERFNSSFQIGMLASFESFLETANLKRDESDVTNFDDADQTDDAMEREGIDVADINRLSRSYRNKFHNEMPHPKMDALVDSLADSWTQGKKSLVFVRRVASVKELKRKLREAIEPRVTRQQTHERVHVAQGVELDQTENAVR